MDIRWIAKQFGHNKERSLNFMCVCAITLLNNFIINYYESLFSVFNYITNYVNNVIFEKRYATISNNNFDNN